MLGSGRMEGVEYENDEHERERENSEGLVAGGREIASERMMSMRDLLDELDEAETKPSPRKKKRRNSHVQSSLEAVTSRQAGRLVSHLMESVERVEQRYQGTDDKWRAKECHHLCSFHNSTLDPHHRKLLVTDMRASFSVLPRQLSALIVADPNAAS
ncbi:hypothetical protein MPTK1_2g22760 [Marchantia polymorpha subsp. ruderalis]|nr:hypothetical protein Mp_2g22760 [Marchantia polymorpha subsp. ruderalis]